MAVQYLSQPQLNYVQQPVVQQPGVIVQQQIRTVNAPRGLPRAWSSGLCDCFEDCNSCMLGCFCFPLHACCVANNMNESFCAPCCAGITPLRSLLRGRHNIEGSVMEDCFAATFCPPCVVCQMDREYKNMQNGRALP